MVVDGVRSIIPLTTMTLLRRDLRRAAANGNLLGGVQPTNRGVGSESKRYRIHHAAERTCQRPRYMAYRHPVAP